MFCSEPKSSNNKVRHVFELLGWSLIALSFGLLYQCRNGNPTSEYSNPKIIAKHSKGTAYISSENCKECHLEIYNDHLQTAHYQTSAIANEFNIKGNFLPPHNELDLESVHFKLLKRGDSLIQTTELKNRTAKVPDTSIDVVIGSGTRGQSFATWKNDELYQLQVSYHTASDLWVNSPGFPQFKDSDRPIRDNCLKCHVTFAETLSKSSFGNRFKKDSFIYGIDCQKCHGPGEKHLAYQRGASDKINEDLMPSISKMSRQQQLDICAQCHSGLNQTAEFGTAFDFLPGETLSEQQRSELKKPSNDQLDVHGNQYGLLTQSSCFQKSNEMICSTCHNPHQKQTDNLNWFNGKCQSCHNEPQNHCSADEKEILSNNRNCVECHMPKVGSNSMTVLLNKEDSLETSFYIRSHLIDIY